MNARTGRASRGCANSMLATEDPVRPGNFPEPESHVVNVPPQRRNAFTSRTFRADTPQHRRWRKRPRTVTMLACDVLAWTIFTVLTGIVLLACCLLLWALA